MQRSSSWVTRRPPRSRTDVQLAPWPRLARTSRSGPVRLERSRRGVVGGLGWLPRPVARGHLPRIARFLPAGSILEIAPGHGRWTDFLREHCDTLSIVDLDAACIDACRERFAGDERIAYHVNDGRSLDMIEDGSVDFAFSFDSLVHADAEVVTGTCASWRGSSRRKAWASCTIRTRVGIGGTSS